MIITSLELETELGELSLVAKLGVVLLEDVILGLKVLRLVTDPLGGVRLGKLLELLEVFLGKVDKFEVVGDPLGCDGLGYRVDTSHDQPAQQDVGSLDLVLVGNLLHDVVLTEVALAGTAKRRVTLGENVLGLEVGNELVLRALDRKLDLVSDGLDLGLLEKLFGTVNVKVGDTDRLDETFLDKLLHLPPGRHDIVGKSNVELDLAIVSLDSVVKRGNGSLGSVDLEVDVPVQQVQVKVLDTQVLQSVLTSKFNVLGVVVELKELGGNVDFLSRDAGSLETLTDFLLVTIGPGTAKDWRNGSVRGYDAGMT